LLMNPQPQPARMRLRKLVSLFGIVLLAVLGFVQAVHAHPQSGQSDDAHCALCVLAHATLAVVLPVTVLSLIFARIQLVLFEASLRSSTTLQHLYSRPPPTIA
jgi:hypothetical protein